MDDHLESFCDTFGQVILLWMSQLRDISESENVTPTEKRLLYGLARFDKLTKKELAETVVLEHSSVSRALDRLEQRGYVDRITSSEDKRYIQLSLTKAGSKKAKAIKKKAVQQLKQIVGTVSEKNIKSLTITLGKMKKAMKSGDVSVKLKG